MKQILLLVFFLYAANVASAQEIRFFNQFFDKVPEGVKTSNVRLYYLNTQPVTIKDYKYKTLITIANIYGISSADEADDILHYYTQRGFTYHLNPLMYKKTLQLLRFRDNGKPFYKITGKNHKVYYEQIWNEEEQEVLREGSGVYTYFNENTQEQITEIFLDSLIVERYGIRQEQKDTIHYHSDKPAEPQGSVRRFYQRLNDGLYFSYKALKPLAQSDGRLYIRFIVTKEGELTDFEALSEKGGELPSRIIKRLIKLPPWKPAMHRGKAVNSAFILPVKLDPGRLKIYPPD